MKTINWRGKIGYGDIVSPICYAANQAQIHQEKTKLIFLFEETSASKYKDTDPETLSDRIQYIVERSDATNTPGVTVEQRYGQELYKHFQHSEYDDTNLSLHNLRFSTESWNGSDDDIAVISPRKNLIQFKGSSAWKDPRQGEWEDIISDIKRKGETVHEIHYETPIEEACNILRGCRVALTYHGSAAWLCKWMGVPMVVYSDNPNWSHKIFPWAVCKNSNSPVDLEIDTLISMSKLERVKLQLLEYQNENICRV